MNSNFKCSKQVLKFSWQDVLVTFAKQEHIFFFLLLLVKFKITPKKRTSKLKIYVVLLYRRLLKSQFEGNFNQSQNSSELSTGVLFCDWFKWVKFPLHWLSGILLYEITQVRKLCTNSWLNSVWHRGWYFYRPFYRCGRCRAAMAGKAPKAYALPGFCRVESGGSSSGTTADVAATVVALPAKNWQWRPWGVMMEIKVSPHALT